MFTIYSADVTGNPGNCSYPHKQVILDADSMKAAICHDYVCAEYRNNYRNGDNFIGSDCLPVDCDNDHTEDPILPPGICWRTCWKTVMPSVAVAGSAPSRISLPRRITPSRKSSGSWNGR